MLKTEPIASSMDEILQAHPFLLSNTFAEDLDMESLVCRQQFYKRENKSNESLAIINSCIEKNPNSYQLFFQRAKWIPWVRSQVQII